MRFAISNHSFNFYLFSKYRTTLMGIAILGVIIGHSMIWLDVEKSIFTAPFDIFCRLVFTEGFLFLSGLGLYYAYTKNNNLPLFFQRRFSRLLIPFICISTPYFIYTNITENGSIFNYILDITSLSFWVRGNYCGMWYISLSVILYFLFLFYYKTIYNNTINKHIGVTILCLLTILLNYIIYCIYPHYYHLTAIAITKIPMFILGIYIGYYTTKQQSLTTRGVLIYTAILCILIVTTKVLKGYTPFIEPYYECFVRIFFMSLIVYALNLTEQHAITRGIQSIFNWLGRYTLELYVIHLLLYDFILRYITANNITLHNYAIVAIVWLVSFTLCIPAQKGINLLLAKTRLIQ